MTMYYCGIDWAAEKLDFCVGKPKASIGFCIDENEQQALAFSVENNYSGYIEALGLIQKLEDFGAIEFAIESKYQHVVSFMMQQGFCVYCVNPTNIYNHRKSVSISFCQSDSVDAFLIARYLRSNRLLREVRYRYTGQLEPIQRDSAPTEKIRIISADRDLLVRQSSQLTNQLHDTLRAYYPQALLMFSDIACSSALSFWAEYPTFEELRKASKKELISFLKRHRCFSTQRMDCL